MAEIGGALDEAFARDGPSVIEVLIDDRATPVVRPMRPGRVESTLWS